ncbi:MarR family winged helix-turn-helix transcriptional regulator [Streptomyces sp. NL15-2K]|uniref:MarR family winged helix-turn-helix transcriptional regulator n=1 Tax=Streptomyces sp. NL15-2K TaxID=376149 RepID=UPI000F58E7AC|nr:MULTISPECIES: MarR family transcriptional regulator [Actinomycetes]WKX10618.1 MarR family transcriptional regulator [Kutzneria buriramensis]
MAEQAQYEELIRQFSAFGAVKREMGRLLPSGCPSGAAAVLTILDRHGDMRLSKLAELLAVDMSVTSRQVAHVVDRGWIERCPDPVDKRSRILRLTPAGREQMDELTRRTTRMLAERLSDWRDDEIAELTRLMARLRASFDDCRSTPTTPTTPTRPPTEPALEQSTRRPATPAITT